MGEDSKAAIALFDLYLVETSDSASDPNDEWLCVLGGAPHYEACLKMQTGTAIPIQGYALYTLFFAIA